MNDLQIVVSQNPGVISTNFEDIKSVLADQMQIYKELEVTEANKTERKKDVATLRKMVKAVNDKKTEVRNEFLRPYTSFEGNVKELIEIINEPISIIDNQVKEFEEAQRLIKIAEINKAYDELITTYSELVDEIGIVNIYDNRWENATVTMRSVKEEMTMKLDKISNDVLLINSMVSDKTEEALSLFWGDLDVMKAITIINRYEADKKVIEQRMIEQQRIDKEVEEERQRVAKEREVERIKENAMKEARAEVVKEEQAKAEIERIKFEAEQKAREEEEAKTMAKEQAEQEALSVKKQSSDALSCIYGISATDEEFKQIEMYLNSLGVEFERIG